ncbi:SusC/RagA family TonB-linked outer membrane protein [Chryseolinea soli]|uniref:TonB-dependent receptor n=1 Tax=Chryseolinea soli TaxID=2321403 RepID=A0A385SJK4_9BACT|nr:TonB-dependent receptor [Chryseolinea soli]AYB31933.1 TonB-dependent receptor [Chryseolinea soli]
MKGILLLCWCFLLCPLLTSAQEYTVSGTVKDETGGGLPGVNVILKGTTRGTTSDANGSYTIAVPPEGILIFSFIGYSPEEVSVGTRQSINVSMTPDIQRLSEVVVVGYGTQKKANLTGSVGSIDESLIESKPITSASQSLAGKIAGVNIAQSSGIAGSDGATITIRGLGTLGSTNPLILVDGVITERMDMLSPGDIQSISVLKDAASASIYGSQAANGVILITTKKGSIGRKPVFQYDGGWSVSQITKQSKPDMIKDPVLFMQLMNEARTNSNLQPAFSDEVMELYSTPSYRDAVSTDWMKEVYQKGQIQEHNVSARGATDKTSYYLSLGYMDQKAIVLDGRYKRVTSRVNLETQITPKIKMGTNFGYTYGNQRTPNGGINDYSLLDVMRATPTTPAYTDDGYFGLPDWTTLTFNGQVQGGNPLASFSSNDIHSTTNEIVGNMYAEWEIIDNLKLAADFNANVALWDYSGWYGRPTARNWRYKEILQDPNVNPSSVSPDFYGFGSLQVQSSRTYSLNPHIKLAYTKHIGDHTLSGLVGFTTQERTYNYVSTSRGQFTSNYIRVLQAGDPTTVGNESRISSSAIVSQFGRIDYSYKDKYLFEANIRRDGSSRFGANYKYGVFPSFSAGWVVTNEDFFSNVPAISFLKIRGSWGQLGNQNFGDDFPYVAKVTYSDANYVWGESVATGAKASTYGNEDLHWETTTMSDVGLEFHLFNSQLKFEADYFYKKSSDVLYNTPIPRETGFSSVVSNLASVGNKGFEASVNFDKRINKFSISGGLNATRVKNKVLSINPDATGETDRYINGDKILARGYPIDSYYLVGWTGGIFQNQEQVDNSPAQFGAGPGDLVFQDVSGPNGVPDGVIDGNDRQIKGTSYPVWTFGANITLEYGGFALSADFQGIADAYAYGSNEYFYPTFQGSNIGKQWIDRWTPENPSTSKPRLWVDNGPNTQNQSTYFLMDRSYLRLKYAVFSYTIPKNIVQRLSMSNIRVYLSAQNPYTWTNYGGFDPERTREASARGGLPQARILKLGLSVTL